MATQYETIVTCDWCGLRQALTEAERETDVGVPDGWAWREQEDLCGECRAARDRALADVKAERVLAARVRAVQQYTKGGA